MTFTEELDMLQSRVRDEAATKMTQEIMDELKVKASDPDHPVPLVFVIKYCENKILKNIVEDRLREKGLEVTIYTFRHGWNIDATYRFAEK